MASSSMTTTPSTRRSAGGKAACYRPTPGNGGAHRSWGQQLAFDFAGLKHVVRERAEGGFGPQVHAQGVELAQQAPLPVAHRAPQHLEDRGSPSKGQPVGPLVNIMNYSPHRVLRFGSDGRDGQGLGRARPRRGGADTGKRGLASAQAVGRVTDAQRPDLFKQLGGTDRALDLLRQAWFAPADAVPGASDSQRKPGCVRG